MTIGTPRRFLRKVTEMAELLRLVQGMIVPRTELPEEFRLDCPQFQRCCCENESDHKNIFPTFNDTKKLQLLILFDIRILPPAVIETMDDSEAGNEEAFDLYCQPCDVVHEHREAVGYCNECQNHLCQNCYGGHKRIAVCRDHTLLSRTEMPQTMTIRHDDDICTETCSIHTSKMIELYCKGDNALCCHICWSLNHNRCSDVQYIPDILAGIGTGADVQDFTDHLQQLKDALESTHGKAQDNKTTIDTLKQKAKADITAKKEKIVNEVTMLEAALYSEIDSLSQDDINKMDSMLQKCSTHKTDLQRITGNINELIHRRRRYKLFVAMKQGQGTLANMTSEVASMVSQNFIHSINFNANNTTLEKKSLGQIHVAKVASLVSSIPIQGTTHVTGSTAVDGDHLAVCDYKGKSVKLINIKENKVVSEITFTQSPWDVTCTSNDTLLVTFPEGGKLQFLQIERDTMVINLKDQAIEVNGKCTAVEYFNQNLLITFLDPDRIEILKLNGQLMMKVSRENDNLFDGPCSLAVSPCKKKIYVANYWGHSITVLKLVKDRLALAGTFSAEELSFPMGMACDAADNLYVISNEPAAILQISMVGPLQQVFSIYQNEECETEPSASILYRNSTTKQELIQWNNKQIQVIELQ